MRICFVGSAKNIHMQRWTKWFAYRGHEIHLITSSPEKIEGVKIHPIGSEEGSLFNFVKNNDTNKKTCLGNKTRNFLVGTEFSKSYGWVNNNYLFD